MTDFIALGDRCKAFEMAEAGRKALPYLPVLARLDGKAFHTFTKGLDRPYDKRFTDCMVEATKYLVQETHALTGYTQSDEITLLFHFEKEESQFPFDGRFQKLTSVMAGQASVAFYKALLKHLPKKADSTPVFDCRVWQVPRKQDACEVFLWREADASKNSLNMLAQSEYSHKELQGKKGRDMHDMLHIKGVNWNDYPAFFKRGTYVQRKRVERELTLKERMAIPEQHRPTGPVIRTEVQELLMPPISRLLNPVEVLFKGDAPVQISLTSIDL